MQLFHRLISTHPYPVLATGMVISLMVAMPLLPSQRFLASSLVSPPVVNPTPIRLEIRIQKAGTGMQLQQAQRRYQELLAKQKELQTNGHSSALATTQAAIARVEQSLTQLYETGGLSNGDVGRAWVEPASLSTMAVIGLSFTATGSQKFAQLTRQAAGTGQSLGVFVNGHLISAPLVGEEYATTGITGGKAVITGHFTPQQAQALVDQLTGQSRP